MIKNNNRGPVSRMLKSVVTSDTAREPTEKDPKQYEEQPRRHRFGKTVVIKMFGAACLMTTNESFTIVGTGTRTSKHAKFEMIRMACETIHPYPKLSNESFWPLDELFDLWLNECIERDLAAEELKSKFDDRIHINNGSNSFGIECCNIDGNAEVVQ